MKSTVLLVTLLAVMTVTMIGCGHSNDVNIMAQAAFEPSSNTVVNWAMLPGGGLESLDSSSSFCINLKVSKATGKLIAKKGLVAYIQSGQDHLLRIFLAAEKEDSFTSREGAKISLDIDGYGNFLNKVSTKRTGPMKLYLEVGDKVFVANLPESKDIAAKENRKLNLRLREGGTLPNEKVLKPVKANSYPNIAGILLPPALVRKQDGLCAIYFFYTHDGQAF